MIATVAAASRHHHVDSSNMESKMEKCCFCFDLRTGSLMICGLGFFEAFGTIGVFGWLTTRKFTFYEASISIDIYFPEFLVLALISCGCLLYGILKVNQNCT